MKFLGLLLLVPVVLLLVLFLTGLFFRYDDEIGRLLFKLFLLLLGPAAGLMLFVVVRRYHRNDDESHDFVGETHVTLGQLTGSDDKVAEVRGTEDKRIDGDNALDIRKRLMRVR